MGILRNILGTAIRVAVEVIEERRAARSQEVTRPVEDPLPLPPSVSSKGNAMVWSPEPVTIPSEQPNEPLKGSLAYRLKHNK